MHCSTLFLALVAFIPLVAAHGKVIVATGDQGGNTTALGIMGGIVPGAGKNSVTEVDTTVFKCTKVDTDGLGKTTAGGKNTVAGIKAVMAQSGTTLPQVSDGGSISGTFHIVTTDGAGPLSAVIDPTAQGIFSTGTIANVTINIPGNKGNIAAPKQNKVTRALVKLGLVKRASNVNQDFPFTVAIPVGTSCNGTVGGQANVCFLKIANPSRAGPFGGVFPFQMAGTSSNSTTTVKRAQSFSA